jgi:hypothetical protein
MKEDRWKKIWDDLKPQITSFAKKAGETISDIATKLGKESVKLAKIAKLKADILLMESDRKNFYEKIGEKIYSYFKENKKIIIEEDKEILGYIDKIVKIDEEIKKKQEEIKRIAEEEKLEPEDIEKIPPMEDEAKD